MRPVAHPSRFRTQSPRLLRAPIHLILMFVRCVPTDRAKLHHFVILFVLRCDFVNAFEDSQQTVHCLHV